MKNYRLLNPGEAIQAGDECYSIANIWEPIPETGGEFTPGLHCPVRREIAAFPPDILRNYKRLLRSLETEAANGGFPYKETLQEARAALAKLSPVPPPPVTLTPESREALHRAVADTPPGQLAKWRPEFTPPSGPDDIGRDILNPL